MIRIIKSEHRRPEGSMRNIANHGAPQGSVRCLAWIDRKGSVRQDGLGILEPGPPEATAAIIRVSGIKFRLIHRLLSQVERILCVNGLSAGHRPWSMPLAKVLVIGAA